MSHSTNPTFAMLIRSPVLLTGFGFGSGLSPRAPGTAGSLVGLLLYWPLSQLPLWWYLGVVAAAFLLGVAICGACARRLGVHDHGGIVWDEIVGIWVTLIAVPSHPLWLLVAFLLFRVFDILKPWPIRPIDKHVDGGFGIMADDLVAALMALGVLHLAAFALSAP